MCVEFRIFGIPFVEVISDQKMNVSFETTLVNVVTHVYRVSSHNVHHKINNIPMDGYS
jgi:hypothetical protein